MNGKYFPHVLLLLAMLIGQMATNAHMIDHMADHVPVAAIDCDVSIHHSDDDHQDGSNLEHPSSDNSKSDCSIYHAYAGANGIAPADRNDDVLNTKGVLFNQSAYTNYRSYVERSPYTRPPSVLLIT